MLQKWFTLLIPLLALTFSTKAQGQSPAYGGYNLYSQGSIRVIGMGGAFAALSDDATGLLSNPAGLAQGKWKYDFGGALNKVDSKEGAVNSTLVNQKYNSEFYTAAMKIGKHIALGIGMTSPIDLKEKEDHFSTAGSFNTVSSDTKFNLTSYVAGLSIKFGAVSIGASGYHEEATLEVTSTDNFTFPASTVHSAEQKASLTYATYGIIYREKKGGIGLSYSPERKHDIDTTANLTDIFWLRDVVIPAKTTLGIFYQAQNNLLFVFDLDMYDSPGTNVILAGTGISGENNGISIADEKYQILRGGLEYTVIDRKSTEVRLQAGGYEEPSRILGADSRFHLTLGAEVRFGPAVLSVAYDQAKEFQNTAASFSFSLGDI